MLRIPEQRIPLSVDLYMVVQHDPVRDRYTYELRRTPRARRVHGPARHRKGNLRSIEDVIMSASAAVHDLTDGRYTEWKAADTMRKNLNDPRHVSRAGNPSVGMRYRNPLKNRLMR